MITATQARAKREESAAKKAACAAADEILESFSNAVAKAAEDGQNTLAMCPLSGSAHYPEYDLLLAEVKNYSLVKEIIIKKLKEAEYFVETCRDVIRVTW